MDFKVECDSIHASILLLILSYMHCSWCSWSLSFEIITTICFPQQCCRPWVHSRVKYLGLHNWVDNIFEFDSSLYLLNSMIQKVPSSTAVLRWWWSDPPPPSAFLFSLSFAAILTIEVMGLERGDDFLKKHYIILSYVCGHAKYFEVGMTLKH